MLQGIEFTHTELLWLLLLLPPLLLWYVIKHKKQTAVLEISNSSGLVKGSLFWTVLKHCLFGFRTLALVLIIVAMARPQSVDVSTKTKKTRGIDIVMAIDVSASMLAKDLKPNRLEALKDVAGKFIARRPNDRIGLVEYAGESYTRTPVTSDKNIIFNSLKEIKYNTIITGGTAIGMGLATAVNRIKDSKAKSKIIILLTDGVNNSGFIDPLTASELASEYGIKTYTIGLGSNGMALSPVAIRNGKIQYSRIQVEIDEKLLKEIAQGTGGKYFRATNNKKLEEIYAEINQLEKTEIEEFKYYNYEEKFRPLVLWALALLVFEFLLRHTLLKSFI
ncbi:aerotolerance protein BatA [Formosa sp. Hel3_A1_48]|jgi:Ca-activated chloride channel family protein|uniref:VWA domain-containing protein n=1 Tax=Formosa sp. Hel3_A1_48 TaxID=1336795 RepID=UPI00084E1060|nr:VWA domain-containing protein [Formosa sp. Hel3_A1_48]MDA9760672.1 VWA domain-containing protein [Flavobacteriaceae bacterium]AOR26324.1 aerotolerance protein BatA [Formosa sp. Hel3_A1_48]MDA9846821.1 VWA domain-containing protein [Flavobacteriaceae bacterium]MDC0949929.1 VWA domain-containing protein [Flavobacteriaceae bacterium]MDG1672224.1 VWA domain-containing protein [Flavobacteriaceae bacterium]